MGSIILGRAEVTPGLHEHHPNPCTSRNTAGMGMGMGNNQESSRENREGTFIHIHISDLIKGSPKTKGGDVTELYHVSLTTGKFAHIYRLQSSKCHLGLGK